MRGVVCVERRRKCARVRHIAPHEGSFSAAGAQRGRLSGAATPGAQPAPSERRDAKS
jgi:hypothetical protein